MKGSLSQLMWELRGLLRFPILEAYVAILTLASCWHAMTGGIRIGLSSQVFLREIFESSLVRACACAALYGSLTWGILNATLVSSAAAIVFARECEGGYLRYSLSLPLSRGCLFGVKFLAMSALLVLAHLISMLFSLLASCPSYAPSSIVFILRNFPLFFAGFLASLAVPTAIATLVAVVSRNSIVTLVSTMLLDHAIRTISLLLAASNPTISLLGSGAALAAAAMTVKPDSPAALLFEQMTYRSLALSMALASPMIVAAYSYFSRVLEVT